MHVTKIGARVLVTLKRNEVVIIVNLAEWADNRDGILRRTQREFADESNIALSTFTKYFSSLSNRSICVCVGHGRLMVNPRMFVVNNLVDRESVIERFDAAIAHRKELLSTAPGRVIDLANIIETEEMI